MNKLFQEHSLPQHSVRSASAPAVAQAQDKWDSAPWIEGKPITFKAGYNTVKQYPHGRAIERFVNRVAERSGENLQIQTFPSEQAGNERQMLDAVILGNLDICKTSTGIISAVVPEFGVFDLPYVFRDLKHMMAVINSKVGQDLAAKLEARNVKILFWMEQGTRSFYTTSKQIKTPNDLKGLKIRTIASPVMVDTINALGATATPMGFGDLYLGLKSGVVDGAENAPDAIWYAKQYEVYQVLLGHQPLSHAGRGGDEQGQVRRASARVPGDRHGHRKGDAGVGGYALLPGLGGADVVAQEIRHDHHRSRRAGIPQGGRAGLHQARGKVRGATQGHPRHQVVIRLVAISAVPCVPGRRAGRSPCILRKRTS